MLESAVGALISAGLSVREAGPSRATLEDVFAELTKAESNNASDEDEDDT